MWRMDFRFFRPVIPPFCLSSNIKTIYALALEYLIAFYPIFLILITYVCIKLHNNNFTPVVWLWKPFHRHFVHFRRRWDSKASIINAFTTFLYLSFSKILFVTFTLLYTFPVQYNHGDNPSKCVLYYDPTVECHAVEYFIFTAIAGCILVVFIVCPTIILVMYPTRLFRRCILRCGFRRWHALHTFVESFQGQYKDGTNGTYDFRMVSASFLILRILTMALFMVSLSLFHNRVRLSSACLQYVLVVGTSCFYAVVKPYKLNFRNNVDFIILTLLSTMSIFCFIALYHVSMPAFKHGVLVLTLLLLVPHMVLMFYICYLLAEKAGIIQWQKRKYEKLRRCMQATRFTSQAKTDVEAQSVTNSWPDRLINPEQYELLLSTTEEHKTAEPTENKQSANKEPKRLIPMYTYGSFN